MQKWFCFRKGLKAQFLCVNRRGGGGASDTSLFLQDPNFAEKQKKLAVVELVHFVSGGAFCHLMCIF